MTYTPEEQKANREKWVTALRSGEFKQGRGRLHAEADEYCCFGVACELATAEGVLVARGFAYATPGQAFQDAVPPEAVKDWLGLTDQLGILEHPSRFDDMDVLTEVNDSGRWTFDQIADVIAADGVKVQS